MIIILLFSLVYSQNLIKNPSFEEIDSNNNVLNWKMYEEVEISTVSHSGRNSLAFKPANRTIAAHQTVKLDKGFQYKICAYIKFIHDKEIRALSFRIQSNNDTHGFYESYEATGFFGFTDWIKRCIITGAIKKPAFNSEPYLFVIRGYKNKENSGYIDDISMERINFRIGINNDRDEVYDKVNVVYQINGDKEDYNLTDFELTTN